MIDVDDVIEQRRRAREMRASRPPVDHLVARQCLALHRGDRWPVAAIAAELGLHVDDVVNAIEQERTHQAAYLAELLLQQERRA